MMTMTRFDYQRVTIAMTGACLTTAVLFYLMHLLIETDNQPLEVEPAMYLVDFVRIPDQQVVTTTRDQVIKPPQPTIEPEQPPLTITLGGEGYSTEQRSLKPPAPAGKFNPGALSEGSILPIVRVQPVYPRAAISRGIEGHVVVEFDVAIDGSVRNPRIIERYPSDIFNRASLNAVLKFRYKPMVENGKAVMVTGVQNRFSYQLDNQSRSQTMKKSKDTPSR